MHCSGFHCKLNQFRYDEKYCDISVRIQSTTMKCHRVVLASISDFFDVMFCSTFRENNKEEIVLHEIDPRAFECILDFAYLGKEPNFFESKNNVYDVLKACDFLRVHNLVELCISHIINHTSSIENVCEIYVFSCLSNYPTLSDALSSYIDEHFYTVSQNQDFLILPYEQLNTLLKKYQSFNGKSDGPSFFFKDTDLLLDVIIRWTLHVLQERKIHFLDLVSIVNIEKISENYLKFLSNKYKINLNGFIDLKSGLEAFFSSKTEDAVPVVVYQDPFKNCALHVFVEFFDIGWSNDPNRISLFSIDKYQSKCQWSCTELENCRIFDGLKNSTCIQMVALEEPYDCLYCLSLESPSFFSYSAVSLNEKKTLKAPHVEISGCSTMSGFQNNSIYLYDDCASSGEEPTARNIVPVFNYKCDLDEWFTVPKLKRNVSYAKLVSDHKLLYLIGLGGNSSNAETHFPGYVQAYDYRTPKWEELTKLSTSKISGRYLNLCCCCLNGEIYASDGKKIEVFDAVAGKWMVLSHNNYAPKNELVMIHEMLPYENHLWIFYSQYPMLSSWQLIIFDPNAMIWLPYKSFLDSVGTLKEKLEHKYLPSQDSVEGIELKQNGIYGFGITFLNAVVFKPLDVNSKYV